MCHGSSLQLEHSTHHDRNHAPGIVSTADSPHATADFRRNSCRGGRIVAHIFASVVVRHFVDIVEVFAAAAAAYDASAVRSVTATNAADAHAVVAGGRKTGTGPVDNRPGLAVADNCLGVAASAVGARSSAVAVGNPGPAGLVLEVHVGNAGSVGETGWIRAISSPDPACPASSAPAPYHHTSRLWIPRPKSPVR